MKNWKTTLGGSLSALGTTLMGVSIVPSLTSMTAAENLKWLVITGFIIQAVGGFFANLFSADQSSVLKMIERSGGDTKWHEKQNEPTPKTTP